MSGTFSSSKEILGSCLNGVKHHHFSFCMFTDIPFSVENDLMMFRCLCSSSGELETRTIAIFVESSYEM